VAQPQSYRVLARKWRPQKFDDIVGQEPVVRTLQNALRRHRVAHAMIFSGVRGVGKTTIARIMAKALNCHNQDEAPCDHCPSCQAIVAGNAMDLHEIDGASNRGIQEIRDLKENIRFMPAQERFKVVIIDEVHMLTTEAFNALLKTLEEPPEHVFFMFATTEIHKVPVTILSRCQRYELKRIPFKRLHEFFASIAEREGVTISQPALDIIAGEADGSVRDGLSLLDQIFSFGGETVTEEDLRLVLGLVDRRLFAKITASLLAADLPAALSLLNETYSQGMDLKRFAQGLLFFCRALLISKTSKAPAEILDISDQELALVTELAGHYSLESLGSVFTLMLKGVEEMQYAAHPRMVLEILFVKLVQVGSIVPVTALISRLDALLAGHPEQLPAPAARESRPEGLPPVSATSRPASPSPEKTQPPITVEASQPARPKPTPPVNPAAATPPPPTSDSRPPAQKATIPNPAATMIAANAPKTQENNSPAPLSTRDVQRDWDTFISHVHERKPWMSGTLAQADQVKEEAGALVIFYDDPSICHMLQGTDHLKLLTELAQDFFQKGLVVRIIARGEGAGETLGQPQEERRALSNDPRVQIALEVLGGQITGIRTGPQSR